MEVSLSNSKPNAAVRSIRPQTIGNRGYFPSLKVNGKIVEYESQIERDLYILLEHADDVIEYQHQPFTIQYKDEGKTRKYTPDVYIKFSDHTELVVEIKDETTLADEIETFETRWNACNAYCQKKGIYFTVLTEVDIRTPRYYNIWMTLASSKVRENDKYSHLIQQLLPEVGISFNGLCDLIADNSQLSPSKSSQIVCYQIYHGLIHVSNFSDELITGSTWISKPKGQKITNPLIETLVQSLTIRLNESVGVEPSDVLEIDSTLPTMQDDTLQRKLKIVEEFLQTPSRKRSHEWRDYFSKKHEVGISTVYAWVKEYREDGLVGLETKYHRSGRKSNWSDEILSILEKGRKSYLKDRLSIRRIYEDLFSDEVPLDEKPSLSSFWRYIQEKSTFYEMEVAARGQQRGKDLRPSIETFRGAIIPMQILQLDNTSVDLFLTDDEGASIGTINLCAAIDVDTRMITGYELTLNPINRQSILNTLVQSILPKERYIREIWYEEDYEPKWEIQGYPVLILVDNGMDYRSNDVKRFCIDNDIILEFAPLKNPQYKSYIENWFNILRQGLKHELQGEGYRNSLKERIENRDLDPEAGAILTGQEAEKWISSWILDHYHLNSPYNDGLPSPYLRYLDFLEQRKPIILPLPREPPSNSWEVQRLIHSSLVTTTRVLKNQIEFENLKYSSPTLHDIYKKVGNQKVRVYYDTKDIRVIWIDEPNSTNIISLTLSNSWASVLTFYYEGYPIPLSFWKKELTLIREKIRGKITSNTFRKAKGDKFRRNMSEQSKKRKKERRNSERLKETNRRRRKGVDEADKKIEQLETPKQGENFEKKEIDWSKVEKLPTDTMYRGE